MSDTPHTTLRSSEMLGVYLKTMRIASGALAASLALAPRSSAACAPKLLHEGAAEPVPELASEEAVLQLLGSAQCISLRSGAISRGNHVLYMKSAAEDGHLLCISLSTFMANLDPGSEQEQRADRRGLASVSAGTATGGIAWIGLRYGNVEPPELLTLLGKGQCADGATVRKDLAEGVKWLFAAGGQMALQLHQLASLLQDPTSQLRGRLEFQAHLKRAFVEARTQTCSLGLSLINPDEFGLVNQRLGRDGGDTALREIAAKLQSCLRQEDAVFHYGSAVFAVVLWTADFSQAEQTAERLRSLLTHQSYLRGAVRLAFSAGLAVLDPGGETGREIDSGELLRRADRALNAAKLSGGGRTVYWASEDLTTTVGNHDRLNGIFTADSEKDYRNMFMLWDTVTFISSHADVEDIAREFVDRVSSNFKPRRVGLFSHRDGANPRLLAGSQAGSGVRNKVGAKQKFLLSEAQGSLLDRMQREQKTERVHLSNGHRQDAAENALVAYAMPMVARKTYLGCLYLEGVENAFVLDSSDLVFLTALANQVAVALDRAELALRWKQEKESESRRLREEVRELRMALQPAPLLYRSSQMQAVLDMVRSAAPTDATVLITGESGTGKELLARTLHEQSLRHQRPFVIVDCGVIAKSLLEAELFGYTKGAYTGAEDSSLGRIAQAEGGTLFLDEIGELPLDVQSKFLRFVQEKEIVPVGSTSPRRLDVRIVAATNRNLVEEVPRGRFRQDLYFRLQVVTISAPPLRERPDDILLLARHFVEKFAIQYKKGTRCLSPESEAALLTLRWPGNVRELQNRILQAVVLSSTDEIGRTDLRLGAESHCDQPGQSAPVAAGCEQRVHADSPGRTPSPVEPSAYWVRSEQPEGDRAEQPWERLRTDLGQQVSGVLQGANGAPIPLGRWLTEDLVLAADAASNGVARQASAILGMAETTFRRHVTKAKEGLQAGLLPRTNTWLSIRPILHDLVVESKAEAEVNVVEEARHVLLHEVVSRLPKNDKLGSTLMGVTLPTYRRWTAEFDLVSPMRRDFLRC